MPKLSQEQIDYILENKERLKGKELAKKFSVVPSAICYVKNKKKQEVNSELYFDIDREFKNSIYNY